MHVIFTSNINHHIWLNETHLSLIIILFYQTRMELRHNLLKLTEVKTFFLWYKTSFQELPFFAYKFYTSLLGPLQTFPKKKLSSSRFIRYYLICYVVSNRTICLVSICIIIANAVIFRSLKRYFHLGKNMYEICLQNKLYQIYCWGKPFYNQTTLMTP